MWWSAEFCGIESAGFYGTKVTTQKKHSKAVRDSRSALEFLSAVDLGRLQRSFFLLVVKEPRLSLPVVAFDPLFKRQQS